MKRRLDNGPRPKNYYPNDDPSLEPLFSWRAHANLLFRNWLNWVYQTTPYRLDEIPNLKAQGRLGTERDLRHNPGSPRSDGFEPFNGHGYGMNY